MRPLLLGLLAALGLAACGSGSSASTPSSAPSATVTVTTASTSSTAPAPARRRVVRGAPGPPRVIATGLGTGPVPFTPVVRWRGQTAAWAARTAAGVALLRFDQRLVTVHLHSGTLDAGAGFRWGADVSPSEAPHLIAAFNGGFRLTAGAGGFAVGDRTGAALRAGLASVVTYGDGSTDIGLWHAGVPAPRRPVASVRQNLALLVAGGRAAANADCVTCWGATLGGVPDPARSALGITADGQLVWAGAENITPAALAAALVAAGATRAVELDINPEWVAAYLYGHHGALRGPLQALAVMPGQHGVPGQFLAPYSRDFFTVVAR